MTTTQEQRQASIRAITGTEYSESGDWDILFDLEGIADGHHNERMLLWCNGRLGSAYGNLADAQQAFAISQGLTRWSDIASVGPLFIDWRFVDNAYVIDGRAVSAAELIADTGFARSTAVSLKQGPDGEWGAFGPNTLRRDSGGVLTEPDATNFCANFNAAPTDTTGWISGGDAARVFSDATDDADLRSAGFGALIDAGVMNGTVLKLDNSAGSGNSYAYTTTGAQSLVEHTVSIFARTTGAACTLKGTGGWSSSVSVDSDAYERHSFTGTPSDLTSGYRLQVSVPAGSVAYFILQQIELGDTDTSPIIVAGSTETRSSNTEGFELDLDPLSIDTSAGMLIWTGCQKDIDAAFKAVSSVRDGSDDAASFYWRGAGNGLRAEIKVGAATLLSRQETPPDDPNFINTLGMRWDSDSAEVFFAGEPPTDHSLASTLPADMPTLRLAKLGNGVGQNAMLTRRMTYVPGQISDDDFYAAIAVADQSTVLFWGDSLTAGTGASDAAHRFPNAMALLFDPVKEEVNEGVGGESSQQVLTRFLAETWSHKFPAVWWAGRNNYGSGTQVVDDAASFVAACGHNNYLILSIINGDYAGEYQGQANYNIIAGINAQLASTYGERFVDVRTSLVASYDPETPQDVIDFGNDIPPSTLRSDLIHLNDAGYAIVAGQVSSKGAALGFYNV